MSLLDLLGGPEPETKLCSRKGCRAQATTQLLWNNPKIHAPDRRKAWLACADHVEWLEDYLQTRGLWKQTVPLEAGPDAVPGTGGDTAGGNRV
ncbi:MAG TPA: hypothetical protein VIG41_08420 [Micrococcaceae bacterium]|jgi:hypothetical protein